MGLDMFLNINDQILPFNAWQNQVQRGGCDIATSYHLPEWRLGALEPSASRVGTWVVSLCSFNFKQPKHEENPATAGMILETS